MAIALTAPAQRMQESASLAARLPALRVEAAKVAAAITPGWHGRARAGTGEDFWQFRPFQFGESARGIDWRRSGRDSHLYVREQELQNAHTIWLWADLSASMTFSSVRSLPTKQNRALVLTLALIHALVNAGERVGLLGQPRARSGRGTVERLSHDLSALEPDPTAATTRLKRFHEVILIGDGFGTGDAAISALARSGARVHMVQVLDPVEETFPFTGRTQFIDPETGTRFTAGRAESLAERYKAELLNHRNAMRQTAVSHGGSLIVHHTDRAATEPLLTLAGLLNEGTRR